jgi:hypothetical protein
MHIQQSGTWQRRSITLACAALVATGAGYAAVNGAASIVQMMAPDRPLAPENYKGGRRSVAPSEPPAGMIAKAAAADIQPAALIVPARGRANDPVPPSRRDQIRAAQSALARLGLYSGQIDGSMGKGTIRAVRAFQASRGLAQTGQLTADVATKLAGETP